jgi:hypothetical protein
VVPLVSPSSRPAAHDLRQRSGAVSPVDKSLGQRRQAPGCDHPQIVAPFGTGAHQVVGDVARMIPDGAGIGMREDHRIGGRIHCLARSPAACMRTAQHHCRLPLVSRAITSPRNA